LRQETVILLGEGHSSVYYEKYESKKLAALGEEVPGIAHNPLLSF